MTNQTSTAINTPDTVEQVLAVPVSEIPFNGDGFHKANIAGVEALLNSGKTVFLPRPEAELDTTHKQLIPYSILSYQGKVLVYERGGKGGESRLHAKLSVGIGGHINPIDGGDGAFDLQGYENAVLRELKEELSFDYNFAGRSIRGFINDNSNPVGQVHLGVVEVFELKSDVASPLEPAIVNPRFVDISELHSLRERLEGWSQIALDNIDSLLSA